MCSLMNTALRNRLLMFGAGWGFVLAAIPAVAAFDDPFAVSPFLVAAHLCAASSGSAGALVAGRLAARGRLNGKAGRWRAASAGFRAGTVQALVAAPLAALSIWAALAINISGFSVENTGEILKALRVFTEPGIWVESLVVAVAVLVYALAVGVILAPISGALVRWLVSEGSRGAR